MNERFINPCVELGGESWLSSETEDLEELPESFGRLQSRGRRGALTHCFHRPSWDGLEQIDVQCGLLAFPGSRDLVS